MFNLEKKRDFLSFFLIFFFQWMTKKNYWIYLNQQPYGFLSRCFFCVHFCECLPLVLHFNSDCFPHLDLIVRWIDRRYRRKQKAKESDSNEGNAAFDIAFSSEGVRFQKKNKKLLCGTRSTILLLLIMLYK